MSSAMLKIRIPTDLEKFMTLSKRLPEPVRHLVIKVPVVPRNSEGGENEENH